MNKNGNLVSCLLLFWFINESIPIAFDFFSNKKGGNSGGWPRGEYGKIELYLDPLAFSLRNTFLFLIWEGNYLLTHKKKNTLFILKMRDPESMDVFP